MSAMKGSTRRVDAGLGVRALRRRRAASRRTGGALRQRSAPRSAASACGTAALSARAPWLPPSTSRRSGPSRPAKRSLGGGSAAISARTGLPTTSSSRSAKLPGKPVSTRRAKRASTRLVRPGARFCSCTSSGTPAQPRGDAARAGGEAAEADHRARLALAQRLQRRRAPRASSAQRRARAASRGPCRARRAPRWCRSAMSCCGTRRVSMPPSAPSHSTGTPRARSACATARPGKMWPPVPPARIITGCRSESVAATLMRSSRASARRAGAGGWCRARRCRRGGDGVAPVAGTLPAGGVRRLRRAGARPGARRDRVRSDTRSSRPSAAQVISTLEPPEEISGSVRPLVGSRPRFTPIETKLCRLIHSAMPNAQ